LPIGSDSASSASDADGSGTIDFDEFYGMMAQLNPMPGDLKSKQFSSNQATVSTVLSPDLAVKLHPLQKRKAGIIIQQMMAAGYVESHCQAVCQALFIGGVSSAPCWKEAWEVFDTDGSGELDADEFKGCLKLLGENVTEERATFLMERADEDRSGLIEFDEFVMLFRAMNPKPTVGGAFKFTKKTFEADELEDSKQADEVAMKQADAQSFVNWVRDVGITEYVDEFKSANLTNPREVATMTLVQLGIRLQLSNSERNMLHGKISAHTRFVATEYERTKLKHAVHFANERAWAAKRRAEKLNMRNMNMARSEMALKAQLAAQRIAVSTSHAKRRIRVQQEEEAKHVVKDVNHPPPRSVSTIKSPSCLRHTMSRNGLRPHRLLVPITPQPGVHGLLPPLTSTKSMS